MSSELLAKHDIASHADLVGRDAARVRIAVPNSRARVNEAIVSAGVESPRPQVAVTSDRAAIVVRSPSEDARASQRASIDSRVADDEPVGARPKAR